MKRRRPLPEVPAAQQNPDSPFTVPIGRPDPPAPTISTKTLEYIRNDALHNAGRTRQLLAELDALRLDIEATIAFLRAQQK